MSKTVVYRQDFEAGAPFYTPNEGIYGYETYKQGFVLADLNPLYPEMIFAYANDVFAGEGAGGSYGLWSIIDLVDDTFQPVNFCAVFAIMGDGMVPRRVKYAYPSAYTDHEYIGDTPYFGGCKTQIPLAAQTAVNRIEFDFQFRTEAIYYEREFWGGDDWDAYGGAMFYASEQEGTPYGFMLEFEANVNTEWDPVLGSHGLYFQVPTVDGSVDYSDGGWANAHPEAWFDLDGAYKHFRFEWQHGTLTWDANGDPQVASDGWARLYVDDELCGEVVNSPIFVSGRMPDRYYWGSYNPGMHWTAYCMLNEDWSYTYDDPDIRTLADRGYLGLSGITQSSTTILTADAYSSYSVDFGNIGVDRAKVILPQREPTNPAGAVWLSLDFTKATPAGETPEFFSVRDAAGAAVLTFMRDGTDLIVSDVSGVIGTAAGVLVEGTRQHLRIRWCFSSYVGGAAQADGYVKVDSAVLTGYNFVFTTLLSVTAAAVVGDEANLPNYWSQIRIQPQGTQYAPLIVWERVHPSWVNRWSVLNLGYWQTVGSFDNVEVSYGTGVWVKVADWLQVLIPSSAFPSSAARVLGYLWSSAPAAVLQARLYNVDDAASAGESAVISGATPQPCDFGVQLASGAKQYAAEVTSDTPGTDIFFSSRGVGV